MALAGFCMVAGSGFLALLQDIPRHASVAVASYLLLTVAALIGMRLLWDRDDPNAVLLMLAVAVLVRLLFFGKAPFLSTDVYRYLWDGRVLLHGIDPYIVKPQDIAVHALRLDWLWSFIDWRSMPSLYPPFSLVLFALADKLDDRGLLGIKALVEIGDLAVLGILIAALRQRRMPAGRAALYAWSPLVIVEFAWSGHQEVWCLAALAAAVLLYDRGSTIGSALALAAAVLFKLYPAALIPSMYFRRPWAPVATVAATVGVAYLPFVKANPNVVGFLPEFATRYHFNDSLNGALHTPLAMLSFLLCVVMSVWARKSGLDFVKTMVLLIAAYLLLSPTVNPWYLTVFALLLPLVPQVFEGAFGPSMLGIFVWLAISLLGYAAEASPAAHLVEYLPVFIGGAMSAARLTLPYLQALRPSLESDWGA
ncbi:MAG: hypothetical protein DLM53_09040 [Candidatus Eremiobacter antarcticus]|nr:MAG: hypothetical protein DLM53_09040 [Candidatus Eremiobacter sp. RRmetagenome_bin22]